MTCSEKYGSEKSTLPDGVANYIYGPKTGNTNLRRHLYQIHAEEYDKAVLHHKWTYKLSSESRDPSTHDARNKRDRELPQFSPVAFLEHLVRFVVADDQVSPNDPAFIHTPSSLLFSQFVLLNALSFDICVWSFAIVSSTPTSLAAIR